MNEIKDCSNCGSLVHCTGNFQTTQDTFINKMKNFSCPCWIDMVGTESEWEKLVTKYD